MASTVIAWLLALISLFTVNPKTESKPDSSTCVLTSFSAFGAEAYVNQDNHSIQQPYNCHSDYDLTKVVPEMTFEGAYMVPAPGEPVDLTQGDVYFTVYAEDGSFTKYLFNFNTVGGYIPEEPPKGHVTK